MHAKLCLWPRKTIVTLLYEKIQSSNAHFKRTYLSIALPTNPAMTCSALPLLIQSHVKDVHTKTFPFRKENKS